MIAAVWFTGTWTTTGVREADAERFARLSAAPALAALLGWWAALAHGLSLELVLGAVQLACCLGAGYAVLRLTRSPLLAAAAALVTLVSPLPEHWLGRPSGLAGGLCDLALLAAFALVLAAARRPAGVPPAAGSLAARLPLAALLAIASAAAVAFSGWAAFAVLAAAAVLRSRVGLALLAGCAVGLGLRAVLGVPAEALAGRADPYAPEALVTIRLLVAAAFAAPAAVFVLTRPRVTVLRGLARGELALLAAAVPLALGAGLLADPWPALFAVQLALVLAAASVAGRLGWEPRLSGSAATALGLAVLGGAFFLRPDPFPPDDAAAVAAERDVVRSAGSRFALVDRGDPAVRARWSPEHLAYLAGHPVEVDYLQTPPARPGGPVLDDTTGTLIRLDEVIRTVADLDALRAAMRFDIMAASERGVLSTREPRATPSGLGVVPRFSAPGPVAPVESIVVVAGVSTTFEGVDVRPGDRLAYLVAKALDVGTDARGTVTVEISGRPPLTVSDDLPPAPHHGSLRWRLRVVDLHVTRPQRVRIRFAASSPSAHGIGDWVAYGRPAVVRAR